MVRDLLSVSACGGGGVVGGAGVVVVVVCPCEAESPPPMMWTQQASKRVWQQSCELERRQAIESQMQSSERGKKLNEKGNEKSIWGKKSSGPWPRHDFFFAHQLAEAHFSTPTR